MIPFAAEGVITGGWEFVWAAYGATWLVMAGYAASLWWRGRKEMP